MTKPLQLTYRVRGTPKLTCYAHPYQATSPTKRKARSLTDSEVLKSSNVANSLGSTIPQLPQLKQLVSNGKVNGKKKLSSEINAAEKVDVKRKKMSNNAVKIDFKDMESQCTEGTELNGHKEVQLQISESGVISAKSIISGIEKIIARADSSVDHNNDHLHEKSKSVILPLAQPGSEPESQIKPQINGVNSNGKINFNYVKLNIPAVNGHLLNSTTPPVHPAGKLASSKKSIKSSPLQKTLLLTPTDKKQAGRKVSSNQDTSFESKKANMQKAIQDLHRQHLNASSADNVVKNHQLPMEQKNVKQNINKMSAASNGTKMPMNSQSLLGNTSHHNPLPFPLSALASSGMTVNLIPSIEVKQPSNGFKGKEILHDSPPPPPPTKKLKHQTTISNGEIRFTSPRNILPTASKPISTCTPSVEASPTKPRKFFKSKQSADVESPRKPVDNNHTNNHPKSPSLLSNNSTISTSKQNGTLFSSNGFHGQTDLKLINSTSSNAKLNQTMTTPSRMATPTTTAVPSASMYSPPNSLSQFFQYWNALQFSSPMGGLPHPNFLPMVAPLVTNNFASMPYLNSRPFNESMASLNTTSTYPMVCSTNFLTNQSELSSPSLSGFKNGVLNLENTNNNVVVPKTEATEVPLPIKNKQKTPKDNSTSLDLSLKKIKAAISKDNFSKKERHSSSLKNHTSPKNNSQSSSTQQNLNTKSHQVSEKVEYSQPQSSNIISDSNEVSEIFEKQLSPAPGSCTSPPPASNFDSGVDSGSGLSTTSENCDKEIELNCPSLTNNEVVESISDGNSNPSSEEPKSSDTVATHIKNSTFSLNKEESINEENICRPSSPSNSNDSTDLVINEDCVAGSSETNDTDPIEGSEILQCSTDETIQSDSGVKQEVVHVECSNHPLNEKANCNDDDESTLSSPCNNNNDPPPSADSCLSIPANKLANNSESSTTGA